MITNPPFKAVLRVPTLEELYHVMATKHVENRTDGQSLSPPTKPHIASESVWV